MPTNARRLVVGLGLH